MYLNDFKQEYLINSLNELNNILTKRFFEDSKKKYVCNVLLRHAKKFYFQKQ